MVKKSILILVGLSSFLSFGQIKESAVLDSLFSEWNATTPGAALGIIKDGELIYSKGYGLANMEYDIPISANSVFRIGSTSKQFTAACIVLLAEQGKLSLDDNLKSIFPEFPDYAEKITIRHLLNHTSGIRDYLQLADLKGFGDDHFYIDEQIMEWLVNQSNLNFAPGEEYLYSNSGYWLLGQIVNKVAGMNMAEFASKEIFEPLEMKDTHFHNDHNRIVKNRATGYAQDGDGNYKINMTTLDMIGDGGIFTTINDIKKWDDAYYNSPVLSKAFWNIMTQRGVLNNGDVIDYASGLMIGNYKGLKTIRHGGAFVGFRAELLRFPDQKLSIAIFANRADANPMLKANQVADVILKNELKEVDNSPKLSKIETPLQEFQLDQLVGNYEIQPGIIVNFNIKNDSLNVVQSWNKSTYNIVRIQGNTFQIPQVDEPRFTFLDAKDGQTQILSVLNGGVETKAKRKKEVDVSGMNLKNYTGDYYSKELDITYNIDLENGVLKMSIEDQPARRELIVTDLDELTSPLGLLKFKRQNGLISGFDLDSGRVKNLKFEKE